MEHRRSKAATSKPHPIRLTAADLGLLRFLAEHRFVLSDHAAALAGVTLQTANRRLIRLADGGYARREWVFSGQPPMHLITRAGLRALGSTLPTPHLDVHTYEHDIGVAWLWLAARRGTFGQLSEILPERTLRSRDARRAPETEPLAVRRGGVGAGGRERLHYPDLLLRTAGGRMVALELELSGKTRTKLETILAAYGADPRIARVLYLVQSRSVARAVERTARRLGVSDLVRLQRVRSMVSLPPRARTIGGERALEAVR